MRRIRALFGWAGVLASLQCGTQAPREPHNATQVGEVEADAAGTRRVRGAGTSPVVAAGRLPSGPSAAAPAVAPGEAPRALPGLPRFDAALRALSEGTRERTVRIAWFGDSHTAADFMTGEVRRRLQARYGAAGPGFFQVGNREMRHDDVRMDVAGKWRVRPSAPAGYRPSGDLRVGLAGVVTVAPAGAKVKIVLPRTLAALRWELVFGAPRGRAGFDLTLGSLPTRRVNVDEQAPLPERVRLRQSGLFSVAFETAAAEHSIQLKSFAGEPEFYGLFVEGTAPGLVIDTYGINGARIRTPLSWLPEAFVGELKERDPELVVLSYGTNEAGDNAPLEWYRSYYEQVLERVRLGAPNADCLLIGPTDRQDDEGRPVRRATVLDEFQRDLAADVGCAYFSLYEAMGGSGGFAAWMRHRPQLAARDGVHLTISGYKRLGDAFTQAFFGELAEPDDALRAEL
jgi:lysophospholipase L1-like esterase